MRFKSVIFVLVVIVMSMVACVPETIPVQDSATVTSLTTSLSSEYNIDENGQVMNFFNTISVPLVKEKNYEIYSDNAQTAFHYYVMDNDGNMIDEGYNNMGFTFASKDGLLEMNYPLFGTYQWKRRYYDVINGRVSRYFETPLQTSGELIAYFIMKENDEVLVVQNVFNKEKYYKEIRRNFSPLVMHDTSPTEFLNNNNQIKISYWAEPNDEIVTETIDLN